MPHRRAVAHESSDSVVSVVGVPGSVCASVWQRRHRSSRLSRGGPGDSCSNAPRRREGLADTGGDEQETWNAGKAVDGSGGGSRRTCFAADGLPARRHWRDPGASRRRPLRPDPDPSRRVRAVAVRRVGDGGVSSFDTTPMSASDLEWLGMYAEARKTTRWEERCAACPVMFRGLGVYKRCCRLPVPQPTRWQRVKARLR
jgi:hypothetical protein